MNRKPFSAEQTPWTSRAHRAWFRLCAVCLSVYVAYVTYLSQSAFLRTAADTLAALVCFAVLSVGLYLLLTRACARLRFTAPKPRGQLAKRDARVFWLALGISLVIFGCAFAACWPGGVSYDASNQWRQAHSGEYNNWHPLLHTLMIRLSVLVCDSYPFAVCVQIVAFSLAMAYLTATLHKRGVPAWLALGAHALVALSLPVRNTLMYLGKDSAMTIGVLVLTAQTVEILFTRGAWLQKPRNAVALGVVAALTSLVRHNAILWTIPLLVCLIFCFRPSRKQAALAAGVTVALMALIQGPLFGALDVVYPSNFTEESVGVPMTVLGDIKQRAPESLNEETSAFLLSLAADEAWQNTYVLHNYNSIKFTYDHELMQERPVTDILRMAAGAAAAEPRIAFEALNGLTDLAWDVTGQNEGYEVVRNSGDLEAARYGRATLNSLGSTALSVLDAPMSWSPVRYFTQNVGVQLLLLLLITLWALYRGGVSALALALPTLLYNMGTMVLLCGNDARFFQFSMTVCIPAALALLYLPLKAEQQ